MTMRQCAYGYRMPYPRGNARAPDVDSARLKFRAIAAYWLRPVPGRGAPSNAEEMFINGMRYVVIHDAEGVVAVYRYQNRGQLKRLRRWPRELDETETTSGNRLGRHLPRRSGEGDPP